MNLCNGNYVFDRKGYKTSQKSLRYLTKRYLDFGYSFSKQMIPVPTRITENTLTLIVHVLTNLSHIVSFD